MTLYGAQIGILIDQYYQELEVWYPFYRLREAGAHVFTVGHRQGEQYSGKNGYPNGYPITADTSADAVDPQGVDAIIVPGGFAPDYMRRDQQMVDLVSGAFASEKVVAAICHGLWLCASAGVLAGKEVTGFAGIADDIRNAGAEYRDEATVQDGRLITARTPDDLAAFTQTVITTLAS